MSEVTVKRIEEIEPYAGPHALEGIRFKPAAKALGVTAWGMNVLEIEPGATTYPEHDHTEDGQEEVYLVLEGNGTLHAGDDEFRLERGMLVRVLPDATRGWVPGDGGITLVAIGSTPGKAYEPRG